MDAAAAGFWGVVVGAVVTLIGTVAVPWLRDSLDRKRNEREQLRKERRTWLFAAMAALLEYRQASAYGGPEVGAAQTKFGIALNELVVRLTKEEEVITDVLLLALAMVQEPRPGVTDMLGETLMVLTLWARGDIPTAGVVEAVETRAKVKFSADRKTARPAP